MKKVNKFRRIVFSLVMVFTMLTLVSVPPTAFASKTSPYYIVSLESGNKIKSRKDYYDVSGGKKIKFHLSYQDSGTYINIDPNSSGYDKALETGVKKAANILRKDVRFDYLIYNAKGKLVASGGSIGCTGTIKVPGNSSQKYKVYITSRLINDGSNIYVKNGSQYAKGDGIAAAKNGRYCIEY